MTELTEFLEKKRAENTQENFDAEKEKWITAVNQLFTDIKEWLSEAIEKGLIELSEEEIELSEEYLGDYRIQSLQLQTEWDTIYIKPIGRMIIGAIGRVDIFITKGNYKLLLSKDRGWIVKIDNSYQELDEEIFTKIIKEILS